MNITSRQLKAFLLTARFQSFSRAADQLFITQSGMSVLVRELEAQLGFRLFERTTRRVTLTAMHHDTPGVRRTPLVRFSLVVIAARDAALRLATEVHWDELAGERLIGFPTNNPIRELVDEHLLRAGRGEPPEIVCNYLE